MGCPHPRPVAQTIATARKTYSNPAAASSAPAKLLLAWDTVVVFVIDSDVNSKTAEMGDKIPLTLAEDMKVGDVFVIRKATPADATVTEVDQTGMGGTPGEVFFQVDSLQGGSVTIKLHGAAGTGQSGEGDRPYVHPGGSPGCVRAWQGRGKSSRVRRSPPS